MNNNSILKATIQVFQECKVKSFPIDCFKILNHYKYRIFTYNELKKRNSMLYEMCIGYSEDAFCEKSTQIIAYNDEKPISRIRFSLMHELGHHVLAHTGESIQNEYEANTFASYILAPRMAIHYSGCKNADDVSKIFHISHEAANHAFDDFRRWHRRVIIYKMSIYDKAMYSHFYSPIQKCFLWSIKKCDVCGKILYNTTENRCHVCTLPPKHSRYDSSSDILWDENVKQLRLARQKWLYDI